MRIPLLGVDALVARARVQLRVVDDVSQHGVREHEAERLPEADGGPQRSDVANELVEKRAS